VLLDLPDLPVIKALLDQQVPKAYKVSRDPLVLKVFRVFKAFREMFAQLDQQVLLVRKEYRDQQDQQEVLAQQATQDQQVLLVQLALHLLQLFALTPETVPQLHSLLQITIRLKTYWYF
jgi:hypothetical protein